MDTEIMVIVGGILVVTGIFWFVLKKLDCRYVVKNTVDGKKRTVIAADRK